MSRKPMTALDAYLECLHILAELPPAERPKVIAGLSRIASWDPALLLTPDREPLPKPPEDTEP
jgi:hypothetical protein